MPIAENGWNIEKDGSRRSPITRAIYETDELSISVWSWTQSGAGAVVVIVPVFPYDTQSGKIEIFLTIRSKIDAVDVDLRRLTIFDLTKQSSSSADQNQLRFQAFGARMEPSTNTVPPYSGRDPYVARRLGSGEQAHAKIVVDIDLSRISAGILRFGDAIVGTRQETADLRFRTDSRIELEGIADAEGLMPKTPAPQLLLVHALANSRWGEK